MRLAQTITAVTLALSTIGACGTGGGGNAGNGDGCGAANDCTDETKEGYRFSAVVDVKKDKIKGNIWVTVTDDRDGKQAQRLNRLAPVSGGYTVAKRPERDILMIVKVTDDAGTPVFAAGMGSVMCKIEHFGGAKDGNIIDVALSGQTLQEVRCLKPRGE